MNKVEMNKSMKLSEHFTLGELTKTRHQTADGNIHDVIPTVIIRKKSQLRIDLFRFIL